jgi:hypothetical protein
LLLLFADFGPSAYTAFDGILRNRPLLPVFLAPQIRGGLLYGVPEFSSSWCFGLVVAGVKVACFLCFRAGSPALAFHGIFKERFLRILGASGGPEFCKF